MQKGETRTETLRRGREKQIAGLKFNKYDFAKLYFTWFLHVVPPKNWTFRIQLDISCILCLKRTWKQDLFSPSISRFSLALVWMLLFILLIPNFHQFDQFISRFLRCRERSHQFRDLERHLGSFECESSLVRIYRWGMVIINMSWLYKFVLIRINLFLYPYNYAKWRK